nr:lipid-A-disaccharide synthase [Pseudomonadota bacterium]
MTAKIKKKIMIVCGEKSGDLLGANLIESLKKEAEEYELEFIGVGGFSMKRAGLKIIFNVSEISVMGLFEVIPHLRTILKRARQTVAVAKKEKIDMLVTIDGAEFSFKVAKQIKKALNIPCIHYVSPQVWAWRGKRVFKMEKFLDHILALFPFEESFYKKTKLDCTYVGHPILERFKEDMPKTAKKSLNDPVRIAILPGSRSNELKYLLPEYAKAVIGLKRKFTNARFMVSVAEGFDQELFERYFSDVEYVFGSGKFQKLQSCDAAIVCSGTANLELGMLGVPMLVCYKMNNLTYRIIKKLVKVKYISPVNIVAEKRIVKELIQDQATAENIIKNISPLLKDTKQRTHALADLKVMRDKMSIQEVFASQRAAKVIKEYLGK